MRGLLPALLESPVRSPRIEDLMASVSSRVGRFLSARVRRGAAGQPPAHLSVHLLALDKEGLWTLDADSQAVLTVPSSREGQLWEALGDAKGRTLQDARRDPGFSAQHDVVGVAPAPHRATLAMCVVPVMTLVEPAQSKARAVLRLVVQEERREGRAARGRAARRPIISPLEQAVMEAVAKVLAGALSVLDSTVAQKVRCEHRT
jgi:hypothetical protein